jgi:hypothetical protein
MKMFSVMAVNLNEGSDYSAKTIPDDKQTVYLRYN